MNHKRPSVLGLVWAVTVGGAFGWWQAPGPAVVRPYWPTPIDSAVVRWRHTHVEVTGVVGYVHREADGDLHIRLVAPSGASVVAECIPAIPCRVPKVGDTVTVRGISRRDPEHGSWAEVHPVEAGP